VATFNGAAYITRQILSILEELGPDDELIVVDDASTDNTISMLHSISDYRIQIHINSHNQGEVLSFSRGIRLARNEFIFLADQDDIWILGRVAKMIDKLRSSGASLVTSNFVWINEFEKPIEVDFDGVNGRTSARHLHNVLEIFLGKTTYFGCAMAFRRDFVSLFAPIPAWVKSHDVWIALAANLICSNVHMDEPTLLKRRHKSNATNTVSSRSLPKKLWARVVFLRSLAVLQARRMQLASEQKTG